MRSLQWDADAGLYDWPGYDGIFGYLDHMDIPASTVLARYKGRGALANLDTLTKLNKGDDTK
jgi:alpha-L-rhamnosidase